MAEDALEQRFAAAQAAARAAGRLALDFLADPDRLGMEMKGPQDFVTAADRAVERLLIERLSAAFPGDAFFGEESQVHGSLDNPALWVIDPIDGTSNFVRNRPEWVISVGFLSAGKPALGVIHHAATDSLYAAHAGRGATRNGAVMAASARTTLDDATLAFETSLNAELGVHRGAIDRVAARGGEYRRYGSAALSLALVADGKLDGFIEARLSAWDVAAGIVLVREAGGWTNDFFANDGLRRGNAMLAAAPGLREEVHALWAAAVAADTQSRTA